MNKRVKLSDEAAKHIGLTVNGCGVYSLSKEQRKAALIWKANHGKVKGGEQSQAVKKLKSQFGINLEETTETETKTNNYKPDSFLETLTAFGEDGKLMNINQYCEYYGMNRDDVHSWKLVTHTGTPYYNIAFRERLNESVNEIDFAEIMREVIGDREILEKVEYNREASDFDSLTFSDTHIGMHPNKKGNALYPVTWNEDDIMSLCNDIIEDCLINKQSDILIVDDLGDFFDGQDGKTTRGGHDLPQTMNNRECMRLGMKFKMKLARSLSPHYDVVIFNNVNNDNHSGDFSGYLNDFFEQMVDVELDNVIVNNYDTFFGHYQQGEFIFIITHGKDEEMKKHGMSIVPKANDITSLDQYIKYHDFYKYGKRIIIKKGDSHQALFDMCSSDDFFYFNYPASSPSSQWIQTNFKKGYRGFVFETFAGDRINISPKFY